MKVTVENVDAFKNWLTKTLSPICDADPQALAKYVLALIKKEKEEQELKDICSDQLDVFLQEKTKEFVEHLFNVLKDKSYIPPQPPPPPPPPPPPQPPKEEKPPSPPLPPNQPIVTAPKEPTEQIKDVKPQGKEAENRDERKRYPDDLRNKLNNNDVRRRSRSPYRDRSPLRNRSPVRDRSPPRRRVFDRLDRRRLSPDRGRPRYAGRYSPDRKRRSPARSPPPRRTPPRSPGRRSPNRSPPPRRSPPRSPIRRSPLRSPARRISRSPGRRSPLRRLSPRRSPRRSPLRRSPLRRSPLRKSPLRRSRSPAGMRPKSKSPNAKHGDRRSRSLSKDRFRDRPKSWSPPPRRKFRPRSWSMSSSGLSSDTFSRSKSRTPPRSPRGKTPDSRGSTPRDYSPYNRTTNTRDLGRDVRPAQRARCRDYDEKGFCMRGDLCPYDHGSDPVVVDDVNLSNVLQLNQAPRPPSLGVSVAGQPPPPPPPMHPMGARAPLLPGQRPPIVGPHGPLRPSGITRPPPPPGPQPPGFNLINLKGATPPPPGTVPIRMPPTSQGYIPRPAISIAPPYVPEPYNPEAPAIAPMKRNAVSYFPSQVGSRAPHQPRGVPPQSTRNRVPIPQHVVTVPTQTSSVLAESGITTTVSAGPNSRTVVLGKRELQKSSEKAFDDALLAPPEKKPAFDSNIHGREVGTGFKKKAFNPNNTTLQLAKVPRDMNNIASINQHFSKFGLITNLQVGYKGDMDSALVTFASPMQARAAYKCTEAVFNNRFVKVFWHNPDDENEESTKQPERKLSVKDRLGVIPPAHKLSLNNTRKAIAQPEPADSAVMKTSTGITKTVFNPAAMKKTNVGPQAVQPNAQPPVFNTQIPSKKASLLQQKKEVLKKKLEIQKKKQHLLQEQLKQQKVLIGKIDQNKSISVEEKNSILKTIKVLADSIEKLKQELLPPRVEPKIQLPPAASKAANGAGGQQDQAKKDAKPQESVAPKSPVTPTSPEEKQKVFIQHKQQAQKAILDTELDIINKSNEGVDTSELKIKVAKLKQEAMALGLMGRGRGRGGTYTLRGRGRGRGSYALSHVIDRRPKQLVVMGFILEEKEDVINHLSSFGEVENVISDDSIPSLNINFKTRQDAENAARDGQAYKKKRLIMTWHKPDESSQSTSSTSVRSADTVQKDDALGDESTAVGEEELDDVDEDALLGFDDDEEGETDRSWKR